ncbi:hypothetical protein FSP39_013186 [Pinctada imbricata]|uniref:C-type lectin domain-containing protein n=1 Tax=Pinctada imbricata TaxID=66713 RepID=A0AA89C1I3_PINIB|nr:hypothetical protein FSP39_013186 [Pinctada imbricata]
MMGLLALTLLVQCKFSFAILTSQTNTVKVSIAHGALTKCYTDQAAWAIDGYCLEIVLIELNWYSARNWCAHRGGDLAEIRTQPLQDSITQHLRIRNGGKNGFWIGATDTDHEGVWQWLHSPRQMGFTNWSPGQGPTDHGFIFGGSLEDCAMIRTDENYEWHDGPCDGVIDSFHYSFICQYGKIE